jgi:CRISPR-associated protein Csy1
MSSSSAANLQVELQQAMNELRSGHPLRAMAQFALLSQAYPRSSEVARWSAAAAVKAKDFPSAFQSIARALELEPGNAALHLVAANVAQDCGNMLQALHYCRKAVEIDPRYAEAWNNLGIILADTGQLQEAEHAFSKAVALKPAYARAHANRTFALLQMEDAKAAVESARAAVVHDGTSAHAHHMLGQALMQIRDDTGAEAALAKAVRLNPGYVEAVLLLNTILEKQHRLPEQLELVSSAIKANPNRHELWSLQADLSGQIDDEAAFDRAAAQALLLHADDPSVLAKIAIRVPSVYRDEAHIEAVRGRLTERVQSLCRDKERLAQHVSIKSIGRIAKGNFFLGYQGRDDKIIQREYADFVAALLRKAMPSHFSPIDGIPVEGRRIRVGFASKFFYRSTAGNYFASWIACLDRDKFEVFVYYTHSQADELTDSIRARADHFFDQQASLEKLSRVIAADKLDVLIYPEIGMDQTCFLLSALRLAAFQVCGWGHPVTPGHRNIDAYISCATMEPDGAQDHYNEPLFLLPGIGTCYPRPAIPPEFLAKSRADYQLPEDKLLILFPQSLFKILPADDQLVCEILKALPDAVLVMFVGQNQVVTQRFSTRLNAAFSRAGIPSSGRVKILPSVGHDDYLRINQLCDFMVDTSHWSGGNTSLDALSVSLPLVTMPGSLMRSRQSAAMLRLAGVEELIAKSKESFVEIATRLGRDAALRSHLRAKIMQGAARIFDDPEPVQHFANLIEAWTTGYKQVDETAKRSLLNGP